MRATGVVFLLTFGAFAGMAQTLTCTFQFVGSGTIGTQSFTNANMTITTVGFTANLELDGLQSILINDSASVWISGLGTFDITVPFETQAISQTSDGPSGSVVDEQFSFGMIGGYLVEVITTVPTLWNMLSSVARLTDHV